ncbi:aldehyde dehydrogenase family protein [SCandidatus Aminicenantes bacterium Aminicenantia_JdfR_composite]|nr:aldehyde dehydrogenase family protein [SCandidatus Aminicenantes bacterium Aminicenantia_JdfR_composite]MCP2596788.1 aldehyde dehydrogenase family protein [Candidatus Aminicenantes bacterium AC-335-G13]
MNLNQNILESINPATGEKIGAVIVSSKEDVKKAYEKAEKAFETWKEIPLNKRLKLMKKVKRIILETKDEIAELITLETGKPLMESFSSDICASLDALVYYIKNAKKILKKEKIKFYQPFLWGKRAWIEYEPLGPIAVISPWNYPLSLPLATIIPAILAGNTVLFKPSEYTPLVGKKIKDIFDTAGFPEGVLNILYGGAEVGKVLIKTPVKKIFFTGSSSAGKEIMKDCSESLKPFVFELGGKDSMIILKDADLNLTVEGAIFGTLFNCGQTCSSVERIFIEEDISEDFIKRLKSRLEKLEIGNGINENIEIGPLQNLQQYNKVKEHLIDSLDNGAKIVIQMRSHNLNKLFFPPTILTNLRPDTKSMIEETFGPLIRIIPVKNWEEAVRLSNSSKMGLSASIWTKNIPLAKEIAKKLEVGTVWINNVLYSFNAMQCPWGGVKESGIGRVHGKYGLLEAVNPKLICMEKQRKKGEFWWFPYTKDKVEILKKGFDFIFGKGILKRIRLIPAMLKWFIYYK